MRRRAVVWIVWRALRREPGLARALAGWSVVEALPALVIGHAVAGAVGGFAGGDIGSAVRWLGILAAVWAAAAIGAQRVVLVVARVVEPFRDIVLTHVVRESIEGARQEEGAAARANLQVEVARDALAAVITVVRSFLFTVAGVVIGLVTLAPEIALLVLPPFLAGLGVFLVSLPVLARRQRDFLIADERSVTAVGEIAAGLRDVVACGAEERMGDRAAGPVREQAAAGRALAAVTGMRTVALAMGGWLPLLAVLAGTPWLLRRDVTPGDVVGALAYVTQSLSPALGGLVSGLGMSGVRLVVTLDRLLTPPSIPAPRRERALRPAIEVREVAFAYGEHAAPLFENLSFTLTDGEHLAVIGPSGIGKSTLAALIAGLLVPGKGEVLAGGVDAGSLHPADRTLIPQEAYVFRGSLLENLRYHAPDTGVAAVARAVGEIGLGEFAERLGGLGGEVDPGALSAGERQLIALGRAYLAPARITILDEATCHLDPAAEARAEEAFMRRGGVLVVIAHRTTSALRAPRVLLMDGPDLALGTHQTLRENNPRYADFLDEKVPT
ncbi:ABC transporter ATP-binding protein [Actinocorallia longicatena]|uniref:ABC transporter ATP-binding protein n=1 Tax=Actinocorallia longicatena TaxID=111803 RepID=A0ABP6QAM3_9ACTN